MTSRGSNCGKAKVQSFKEWIQAWMKMGLLRVWWRIWKIWKDKIH